MEKIDNDLIDTCQCTNKIELIDTDHSEEHNKSKGFTITKDFDSISKI